MGKLLKELFEKYAKRLLTGKVRPSISEEGIMTIPNNQRVKKIKCTRCYWIKND